jgi:hypothetical protein
MFLPTLVPRRRHKTRQAETPMVLPMRLLLLVLCSVIPVAAGAQTQSSREAPQKPRRLAIANKPWTGDFDKLLERRMIRVYAPFSRSLYFSDKGRERGLAVELRLGAVPESQAREAARQPPTDDLYRTRNT